jgi:hypothetical protein|tara:strand:+ start:131 stop:808 length:678 start_codon:yes stop_codon:yes gene_type:complete
MRDVLDRLNKIINEGQLGSMADRVELDHEVQMARADLYKLAKYSIKLHDMLKNVSELNGIDGWQASKITQAADYIGSVYHSMDAETTDAEAEMDALADIVMPAEHDHKVCADCGDKMHEPTTDCMHDCHDEQGKNWIDTGEENLPMVISTDDSEMGEGKTLDAIKSSAKDFWNGTPEELERDEQSKKAYNKHRAEKKANKSKVTARDITAAELTKESKFSDWGKK